MATFYNWSTTPASNASVGNIDWAEGMAPSQVNNSARQEMADVAAWRDFFGGAKTTSGTDTITLTSGMTITAYASNQLFVAKLGGTNTGAATLNIDSLGTKAVEINGSAVTAGELVAGKFYMFVYDGTAFQASRVSAESGFTNPMTTQGDMIRGGGSGVAERVAIGAANTVLISDATDADWSKLPIASLANGTDGEIITWDAAGAPAVVATGTAGQILTSGGAGVAPTFAAAPASGMTLGTEQATTSGTSFNFGSIPAGTTLIAVLFEGVSFSSTVSPLVQIGDAGGIETSGYVGASSYNGLLASFTYGTSFQVAGGGEAPEVLYQGIMWLALKDATNFTWTESHIMYSGTPNRQYGGSGNKSLTAELTQITISGGTFDGGSINIMYQ